MSLFTSPAVNRERLAARTVTLLALVVCIAALGYLLIATLPAITPAAINATQDAATVAFTSPNVQTALRHECVPVDWDVTNAQAVSLNGTLVEASGSGESCGGARPTLAVTFESGRSRHYRLPRVVVFDLPEIRLLIALSLLFALVALHQAWRLAPFYRSVGAGVERRSPRLAAEWRELSPLFRLNLHEASRVHRYTFLAILLLALVVRIAYISTPMAIDEAMTYVNYVRLPVLEGLSDYSSTNNHLLHTLIAHISVALFGNQEWGVRLPAFIFGLLALPMTYVVGLRLYNRNAALLGMALVAASVLMIEYSVNARGYSLGTFIFLVQIVLAWHLRVHRNRTGWALFGILSAVSLGTIPTMLYAVATIEAWLLLSILLENRGRERWLLVRDFFLAGLLTVALTALFYLGVLLVWGLRQIVANQFVVPQGFRGVVTALPPHIIEVVWIPWNEDWPALLAWLLLAAFVVGLVLHRRIGNTALPLALVALVVPPTIVVVQRVMPYIRSWQYALPLYVLVASAALLYIVTRLLNTRSARLETSASILALAAAFGLTALVVADRSIPTRAPLPEGTEIALALEPRLYTDDVVILDPSYRPLRYYFEILGLDRDQVRNRNPRNAPAIYVVVQPGQTVDALLEAMQIETAAYSVPALVEQLDEAEIYLLTREPATT